MADARYMPKNIEDRPEWWNSDHWATPWPMVRELEAEFESFDLDPCCLPDDIGVFAFQVISRGHYTPEEARRYCEETKYS